MFKAAGALGFFGVSDCRAVGLVGLKVEGLFIKALWSLLGFLEPSGLLVDGFWDFGFQV